MTNTHGVSILGRGRLRGRNLKAAKALHVVGSQKTFVAGGKRVAGEERRG